jgi:phage terminase large subunit-like protein
MKRKTKKPKRTKPVLDATTAYAQAVLSGDVPACKWVRLACQRHIDDLKREDVWFDTAAAERFFRYCGQLQHYKGPERGKPIVLEPWQKFFFGCVYGWKRVHNGKRTDLWRFNYFYLEVPRKNGKTTLCAAGASYDCGFLENTGAEVYCLATKEDQAKLLYNDVAAFISQSEGLSETFEILKGKNTIFAVDSARTSFIKPLGSDSQRLDGLNPFSAYCDELHAWPKRELWDVMDDAFGARTNWHMGAITTAGHNRQGICYEQRQHLIRVLKKEDIADNVFGVIYTVEHEQEDNWDQPKNWYIANPNLGTGKELSYMQSKATGAKQMPSSLNTFKNKQLNIWTDVAEAWLQMDTWDKRRVPYTWESMARKRCVAGMDLARVNDLSAVAYVFPKQPGVEKVRYLVDFYLPDQDLQLKSERDGVDYRLWKQQGWLKTTPGNTTDFSFIHHDIVKRCTQVVVDEIAYDRHFAGELVNTLQNEGLPLVEIGMGFISMAAPTAEFERLAVSGEVEHDGNPILTWNCSNTVIRRDPVGNMKPDKELSQKRIDGVVACIMGLARLFENTNKPSVYESRGALIL